MLTLDDLSFPASAQIACTSIKGKAARRLKELGVLPGEIVFFQGRAPFGGAIAFSVRGTVLAIRSGLARQIFVRK